MKALELPWAGDDVPHAVLDINRGCTIRCRACYNMRPRADRLLADLEATLDEMARLRRLHTVTIGGGEPTLHPQLPEIVAAVRRRGLRAALMTNGMALNGRSLDALHAAGLDLVLLHIDAGQMRPDLPRVTPEAVQALREEKARLVVQHGIAAGLIVTVYKDQPGDFLAAVELLLTSDDLRFAVFTGYADFEKLSHLQGTLSAGFSCERSSNTQQMTSADFRRLMADHFGAAPFSRLPSRGPLNYDAWLGYRAVKRGERTTFMTSSLLERVAVRLLRIRLGRHVFFHAETERQARLQSVLNAALGGRVGSILPLLLLGRGAWTMKHIVCQQGPTPDAGGGLSVCRDCPDAVLRDERWIPVCISDRLVP